MLASAHRAHLDEKLARDVCGQQPVVARIDGLHRGCIGQHADDLVARASERSGRRCNMRTRICSRFGLLGSTVPYRHIVAVVQQAQSDGGSHPTSSGNADLHLTLQRNGLF